MSSGAQTSRRSSRNAARYHAPDVDQFPDPEETTEAPGRLPPELPGDLSPGFRQRFEALEILGSGTFGTVFRARDRDLDRLVVLKLLHPDVCADRTLIARFRREAEAMAQLAHRRLVPLLDHGRDGDRYFLLSPDLDATSLDRELQGRVPLELGEAVGILREILEGLEALHGGDLVHRDLKPANILRLGDGILALADLGLVGVAGSGGTLTATDEVIGTPAYLAPEQIRGDPPAASADLYAVGVLAYELLAGKNPFVERLPGDTLQNHLTRIPAPPREVRPEVPGALSAWVLDMLEKDPRDRPASAREARRSLVQAHTGGAEPRPERGEGVTLAGEDLAPEAPGPAPSRRRGRALLPIAALGLAALAWWYRSPTRPPPPVTPFPDPAGRSTLPREFPQLAAQELAHELDRVTDGTPHLDTDPAAWGRAFGRLTTLSRFHAWLATGGRPEDLPEETRRALRDVDSSYSAVGYPRPFGPFLEGRGDEAEHFSDEDWRDIEALPPTKEVLEGPFLGWLGEAYRVARDLEGHRLRQEAAIRRAIEENDPTETPPGFLRQWQVVTMHRTAPVPGRPLGVLSHFYLTSARNREALTAWSGEGP
jgi:hypothetical protein